MQRLFFLLVLCSVFFFGCGPRKDVQLYIYCSETFWYVMQEEALFFNKIYGSQIILIPIRAERTSERTEGAIEIGSDHSGPSTWLSMPSDHVVPPITDIPFQINPDIEWQINRIAEEHFGDMFLSDSPRHLEKVRTTALSAGEFPFCYLTLTMLVPMGNPHQFRSVKEVLDTHRRLGIVDPSFDGLGEASWHVLGKIVPGGESAIPMELLRLYERQYDLLEALELGNIDAALVWNATSQSNFLLTKYADSYNRTYEKEIREAERRKNQERLRFILQAIHQDIVETKSFAEEVPLTENPDERHVVAVRLAALSSAFNYEHCKRFADFIRSNRGREILRRYGFVVE